MADGALRGMVRVLAVLSVVTTVGAGVAAGVVQISEEPGPSAAGAGVIELGPDPFAGTFETDYYVNWAIQTGVAPASGTPAKYRVPLAWTVRSTSTELTANDGSGGLLATGHAPAYDFGNRCQDGATQVPAAWTVLADPVVGDDATAGSRAAVDAWVTALARNAAGVTAPLSEVETLPVTLGDGTAAVRSRVRVDLTVFDGPCLPDEAELAATTVATDAGLVSLIQARYLLEDRGVGERVWAGIAASLVAPKTE